MSNILVSLIPYVNGVADNTLRFTVVRTSLCNIDPKSLKNQLIAKFGHQLGSRNVYNMRFTRMWGAESILMEITGFTPFKEIYEFVDSLAGCVVDRSRYPSQHQMHINTHGDASRVGTSMNVTFAFTVTTVK